ncbi:hypothetical protein PGT21_007644 [Puccinia graminis f. sp. tritici]|uniref:Uncharacterized protein n=1 Tax=Puccinia graminis f. sp. tritici TaxID=56615 RepID=A0A5B0NKU1_PUCGR|nr:hypothetical protein PGT21_007644 [Puccinia graminis f. sp. tritici]
MAPRPAQDGPSNRSCSSTTTIHHRAKTTFIIRVLGYLGVSNRISIGLLQRYRKSDDSITLALNRSFLLLGSPSDHHPHQHNQSQPSTSQCAQFWKILTASWVSREDLIRSCIDVVDRSVSERSRAIKELSSSPGGRSKSEQVGRTSGAFEDDITRRHRPSTGEKKRAELEAEVYTAELKRRMIHDELAVESAIRNQALQKFRARCSPSIFPVPDTSPQVNLDPHPVPQ